MFHKDLMESFQFLYSSPITRCLDFNWSFYSASLKHLPVMQTLTSILCNVLVIGKTA